MLNYNSWVSNIAYFVVDNKPSVGGVSYMTVRPHMLGITRLLQSWNGGQLLAQTIHEDTGQKQNSLKIAASCAKFIKNVKHIQII